MTFQQWQLLAVGDIIQYDDAAEPWRIVAFRWRSDNRRLYYTIPLSSWEGVLDTDILTTPCTMYDYYMVLNEFSA